LQYFEQHDVFGRTYGLQELYFGEQVAASAAGKISTSMGEDDSDCGPDGAKDTSDAAMIAIPRMMVFMMIPPC
jgi:hypothetical protein